MNPQGLEAQQRGAEAEQRVIDTAQSLGYRVEVSSSLDYSQKTDCLIEGIPVQISCKPKSSNQVKILRRRGIVSIVAGEQVSDRELINSINLLFVEA